MIITIKDKIIILRKEIDALKKDFLDFSMGKFNQFSFAANGVNLQGEYRLARTTRKGAYFEAGGLFYFVPYSRMAFFYYAYDREGLPSIELRGNLRELQKGRRKITYS